MKLNYFKTLFVAILVIFATTTNAETYSGTCGNNVNWSLYTETGLLRITGTGEMNNYYSGSSPWYSYKSNIKSVEISEGVTSIGRYAFYYCSGLTSVTIPNSVTSIGEYAFRDCSRLTSVTIPNSVTSIGNYAFCNCSGLTSITIPNSVTSIGAYAFLICTGLTSVTIGNSVTSIGQQAFDNCDRLTSITIPNSVTSIGAYAFLSCSGLTSIDVASDNANYSSIDGVLFNKDKSQLIVFPEGKKGEFVIPNSVTSIKTKAFSGCSGLTDLRFEDGEKTLSLGRYDAGGTGKGLFYDCPLKTLYLGRNLSYDTSQSYGYSPFCNKKSLISVTIGNGVTSIGNYAFYYCDGLTSITIPNSVTSIGESAFSSCSGLTRIDVASDNANYTSIDGVVFNKDKTQIVIYPGGKKREYVIPNSVTSIESSAFSGCSGLTDLRFEDGEKTLSLGRHSSGKGLFYDCPLKTLYLGRNLSYDTSQSYGYSPFCNKKSLISVTIGDSVTSIGNYAFNGCSGLTSITIPNSVTSIGNYAFRGCSGLTGVYITDLKAWCNIEFGYSRANPLYYAEKLYLNNKLVTNLVIPKDVTDIKDYAFYNCNELTSISIPNSVTSIGDSTFYCNISAILTLCATPPTLGTNTFSSYSIPVHLFGDASDMNVYKSTSGWSKFKNYVTHELPLDFTAINEEKTITYRLTSKEEAYKQHVSVIKGEEAYRGNINIPDTVNYIGINFSVTSIGDAAFSESNIVEIGLPQTLEKIGDEAFYGCSRLRNMTYPESLKSIGVSAFEDCVKMTEVVLCENVEKIEAYAFAGCTGLTNVYSLNPVPPVCDVDAFYGIGVEVQPMTLNKAVTNVSLYVPEGSVSAYQAAPEWCNFYNIVASNFVGIEDFEIDTNSDKPNAYISGGVLMLTGIDMPTNVAVYNLSGTNVANVMVTPDSCSIDLSNLPKGIYIVAIKGNAHKVIL